MRKNSTFAYRIISFLVLSLFSLICLVFCIKPSTDAKKSTSDYPKNILITNDDGIMDKDRLYTLAKAVSKYVEQVIVVVPSTDRSGTSNYETVINDDEEVEVESELVLKDNNISIYVIDGYPADCVLLGGLGIFYEHSVMPDLVISGINGGQNEGHMGWFGSGTVGAARTAAHMGIPAIAISGIDEDKDKADNKDEEAVSKWIAEFIKSDIVKNMRPCEYLTISLPDDYGKIQGAKIGKRQTLTIPLEKLYKEISSPIIYFIREKKNEVIVSEKSTWNLKFNPPTKEIGIDSNPENDVYYLQRNFIVIVPMTTDENNYEVIKSIKELEKDIPSFVY